MTTFLVALRATRPILSDERKLALLPPTPVEEEDLELIEPPKAQPEHHHTHQKSRSRKAKIS
jgi:hypothetical protein